jgi:hypothetical protein
LIIHKNFPHSYFQGEFFQYVVDVSVIDSMRTNFLDGSRSCHNEFFFQKTRLFFFVLSLKSIMKQNFVNFENSECFYSQPLYDEYENGEEQNSTSTFIDMCNSEPVFYDYESDVGEIDEGNQPIQDVVVYCHKTNDIHALISAEQVECNLTIGSDSSQKLYVHLKMEDYVFTVDSKVMFHYLYDPMAAYLEGFSILNLLSFFQWDYKV